MDEFFVRCWFCGMVGTVVGQIHAADRAEPVATVAEWPTASTSHDHAAEPPTADELVRAGYETLSRIYAEAIGRPRLTSLVFY